MNCCTNECNQGRNCPIRAQLAASQTATPPIMANSDGSQDGAQVRASSLAYDILRNFLLFYAATALIAYCLL